MPGTGEPGASATPLVRGGPVPAGGAAQLDRIMGRVRFLAAVVGTPRLAGPPISLGRRSRIRFGPNGSLTRGRGLVLADGFSAFLDGALTIGDDVYVNRDVNIAVFAGLVIGNRCRFGERVSIHDEDHLTGPGDRYRVSPVRIGNDVWLGANAVVLRGVSIGDGAVVAAGSVVRGDVPPGALAAGVPARVVRTAGGDVPQPEDAGGDVAQRGDAGGDAR